MSLVLEIGRVVAGRYRLERPLGHGGMGEVWAATHTVTRRTVAMKFVRGPGHARPELRRRFMREARAVSAVTHPNVVDVLDVFELDAETPVMVMELLSGETLGKKLSRDGQLDLADALAIMLPTVSAVGTAHAYGVVHRDLKPENLFLVRSAGGETTVKVLDFGIAKLTVTAAGETGVTETGTTLGTPCYMAPEQAMGEKDLDHRVDLWALGVILYEVLSGARPIEGDSVGQVVKHLMTTGITPLDRVVPGLPAELTALMARMLSRERNKRPEDLREVFEVLGGLTKVRARVFGAPGSEAQPPLADPGPELDSSSEREAAAAGNLRAASTVPDVGTAGPHAVPSRAGRSRPAWLWGSVGVLLVGSAIVYAALSRRAPSESMTSAGSGSALPLTRSAPGTASNRVLPRGDVAVGSARDNPPAPTLAASASAVAGQRTAGRRPVREPITSRAAKTASSEASSRPAGATSAAAPPAPSAKQPARQKMGGLAETPPY